MKLNIGKVNVVLLLAILLSIFASTAAFAQEHEAIVEVIRLTDMYIGIKITFPSDISGNFAGSMREKYFSCLTVPPNVLYCIGPFRVGMDPSLLTIYDTDTKEFLLQTTIYSPKSLGDEDEPAPEVDPCEENPESFECLGEPG
jgi:hypothetical protein